MMEKITCIVCPKGCQLSVFADRGEVAGNACPRGKEYGLIEVTAPTRVITSTVQIEGAIHPRLPVKTSKPVPKGRMMEIMDVIWRTKVSAPIKIGDVIIPNILDTGADIVACRNM